MKTICLCLAAMLLLSSGCPSFAASGRDADFISRDTIFSAAGVVLTGDDRLSTPGAFQPPVEIFIVAKTDSTNLRIAYAADQVIFNWERKADELRVDGGPAAGINKAGAGAIPVNQYVAIKWVVTPKRQTIYVNGEFRYEHLGDYSQINRCVSVFTSGGAQVTVKSIQVRRLPTDTE